MDTPGIDLKLNILIEHIDAKISALFFDVENDTAKSVY
jgi:hypothetical protein